MGLVAVTVVVLATFGTMAVATDAVGAGRLFDRAIGALDGIVAGRVPDRPAVAALVVTPPAQTVGPSPTLVAAASTSQPAKPSISPGPTPTPEPTPEPTPARLSIDLNIASDPKSIFATEAKNTWCSPAAVQITLAFLGKADTSVAFQREIQGRVHEWESYSDSHNGLWGPRAMARALDAYGAPGYEVRTYKTRQGALRDAAKAIEATGSPVLLLAWWGAHTWVMTGFRSDADPAVFADATVAGAYIVDPWFPRVSSIWGASDPPGTFQDRSEMIRNYVPWARPEGRYVKRDGLFIAVVPTVPASTGD